MVTGKNLIMAQQKFNQLYLFQKKQSSDGGMDTFQQVSRTILKENPAFVKVCTEFHFVDSKAQDRDKILFTNRDSVFILNINTGDISVLYKFKKPLSRQPANFDINDSQDIFIVASQDDGIYVNTKTKTEVDIDELFDVGLIKNVKYESKTGDFYLLCNRNQIHLGFYVLRFNAEDVYKYKFLINFKNKLDIGDVEMSINYRDDGSREVVIGYKSIYINVYTINILEISTDSQQTMIFSHEAFQLWESACAGLFL